MRGGYFSFETLRQYLEEIGVLGPAGDALGAMLLASGGLFLAIWLYGKRKSLRISGDPEGARTRKKVAQLRAQGDMEGAFTFADAAELAETGTIRKKSLADKIKDCVIPIEALFRDEEHHLVYQLEMQHYSDKEVANWIEVAHALDLPDISRILEEVVLIRDVLYHPDFDPDHMTGEERIDDRLRRRALELHNEFARIDGLARLRRASENHLRRTAPDMLPLPTF